jgi:hypothetical protein
MKKYYVSPRMTDPFVKVYLLGGGRRQKKKKTTARKNSDNPRWNEAFTFDIPSASLSKSAIEVCNVQEIKFLLHMRLSLTNKVPMKNMFLWFSLDLCIRPVKRFDRKECSRWFLYDWPSTKRLGAYPLARDDPESKTNCLEMACSYMNVLLQYEERPWLLNDEKEY